MSQPYTIYFAGELFSLKHLAGNALLADYIHSESQNRYYCALPQDLEQRDNTPLSIRDGDILSVVSCDCGLFHFDGPELDSGTVVEFLLAKLLDIPSVIVRTDFRQGGDSRLDPWNLMVSNYPRTKVLILDGLGSYQKVRNRGAVSQVEASLGATRSLAKDIVTALDQVRAIPPVLTPELRGPIYEWFRHLPGESFARLLSAETTKEILSSKIARGLL